MVLINVLQNANLFQLPTDVRRYFVTPQESGELCLMSCLLGGKQRYIFPKVE